MRNRLRNRRGSAGRDRVEFIDYGGSDDSIDATRVTHAQLRRTLREQEWDLARRVVLNRVRGAAWVLGSVSVAAAVICSALWSGRAARLEAVDAVCGAVFAVAAGAVAAVWRVDLPGRRELSAGVEHNRETLRLVTIDAWPPVEMRRQVYREGVADLIEQYRSESVRYRRVHNGLQVLVMTGSAGSTTVAALDWGQQPTWQGITLTGISFAVTMASAFTGYYKYRERSYFLQETADAIEEQANALTLGVGEYERFKDDEDAALAHFTRSVEQKRNEQRRRQQQLDQPTERAEPDSRSRS
jgi:hypothetical protein